MTTAGSQQPLAQPSPGDDTGSWSQVTHAYYYMPAHHAGLVTKFEANHGQIEDSIYCTQCVGAAVLTRKGRLEIATGSDSMKGVDVIGLQQLLFECEELRDRITEFLPASDRMAVLSRLYAVISHALGSLDELVRQAGHLPAGGQVDYTQHGKELAFLGGELNRVREKYLSAAARGTQVIYFKGMLIGACYLAVALVIAGAALALGDDLFPGALLAAAAAGGIGAIVSVMWRMTVGKLSLDPESGLGNLKRLGSIRPIIGAVFALAVFVLAEAEIVPLEHPADGAASVYFYSAVGFIAGFSERFAQDMLAGGEQGLAAGTR